MLIIRACAGVSNFAAAGFWQFTVFLQSADMIGATVNGQPMPPAILEEWEAAIHKAFSALPAAAPFEYTVDQIAVTDSAVIITMTIVLPVGGRERFFIWALREGNDAEWRTEFNLIPQPPLGRTPRFHLRIQRGGARRLEKFI